MSENVPKNTLKLFGFTASQAQALHRYLPGVSCESGNVEKLCVPRPSYEVWLVCVEAIETFVHTVQHCSVPPDLLQATGQWLLAVLWVPAGAEHLLQDVWEDTFQAQLQEEHAADRLVLQRLMHCPQVLLWETRVEELSAAWFAALPGSPCRVPLEALPLEVAQQQHLQECIVCCEEVYDCLQRRAVLHWTLVCPSSDALTLWLETDASDTRLEAHICACGVCHEMVQRQAWLWEGAGLLSSAQVSAKLAAVAGGIAPGTRSE